LLFLLLQKYKIKESCDSHYQILGLNAISSRNKLLYMSVCVTFLGNRLNF